LIAGFALLVRSANYYSSYDRGPNLIVGTFLDDEIAKWAKVISTAGFKPEQ
jgi:hypothetical protein